jgi:hypothetical protein
MNNEHAPRPNKRPRRDETRERKRVAHSAPSSSGAQRELPGRAFHYRVPRADDLLQQASRCSLSKVGVSNGHNHTNVISVMT